MKIVAGMGELSDYEPLVKAGADEVFCGYVPISWNKRYSNVYPLNRREVLYYPVQIGSLNDMKILYKMYEVYGVKVTVTFNSLYYTMEQYKIIEEYMIKLSEIGYTDYIIADVAFIKYLHSRGHHFRIHISGEATEINRLSMKYINQYDVTRYIFHRKNTIEDMRECIACYGNYEYEAFILNERCHFTGGYCNSLHCDELAHMCTLSYSLIKRDSDLPDMRISQMRQESNTLDMVGSTGCGLCALPLLKSARITHLKVVGRGNHIKCMEEDVRTLREALKILRECPDNYRANMKRHIFKNGCSGECYYR